MAYTNITYNNPQKQSASKVDNSNRFKINEKMLAMIAKNPALGIGYIIGSALGENYWGKKQNKSTEDAATAALNQHGYGQTPTQQTGEVDWDQLNKIMDAYTGGKNVFDASLADAMKQQQGWFVPPEQMNTTSAPAPAAAPPPPQEEAAPVVPPPVPAQESAPAPTATEAPPTPQQANAPAVTLDNVGALGGMTSMQDAWKNMANQGTYNAGNTGMYTNGVRDMDNVVTTGSAGPRQVPGFETYLQKGLTDNPTIAKQLAKRAQDLENMRWKALNQVGQNPPTKQFFIK